MSHLELTANGERVEMTEVLSTMVPVPTTYTPSASATSHSIDFLIMPVSMPNFGDPLEDVTAGYAVHAGTGTPDEPSMPVITNQPADVNFIFADSSVSFEIDYTDPNGETPGFIIIPADPSRGIIFTRCVWMTHALRDFLRVNHISYKLSNPPFTDFAQTGFYDHACNTLPPQRSLVLPLGPDACPTGSHRCGDDSCIPIDTLCTPGAGTCGTNMHWCGARCVPRAELCCKFTSDDPGCCPNGPGNWPCVPPLVAGPPVQMNASLPTPPSGGGSSGGGSGGGGTEVWMIADPGGAQARVTISSDGTIASSGMPQWTMKNNAGDCSFPLPIAGKLSGTSFTFSVSGSGCGNFSLTGNGSGTANGSFGVATQASGSLHETANSPLGPVSQDGTFVATRVQ